MFQSSSCVLRESSSNNKQLSIVRIKDGTFYRRYPIAGQDTSANPPIFPGLTFDIASSPPDPDNWAVVGSSNSGKTTFFEILRGQHLCFPPAARSFPYLSSDEIGLKNTKLRIPAHAIHYVGFDGEGGGIGRRGARGAYLSARYESRREDTDFSVLDYLKGNTNLNLSNGKGSSETESGKATLDKVIEDLKLKPLIRMPMGNLSNGQIRRARIAKALMGKPEVLLLDEPFSRIPAP